MDITNKINELATAHAVMKQQAGTRMIVTFHVEKGDHRTNKTSHYGDIPEVIAEWDSLIERYGEDNVTISSAHSEAITNYIKAQNG